MNKNGLQNCFIPYKRIYSDETMEEINLGKRALISSIISSKMILSKRVKEKKQCGYHLSKLENIEPQFLLFNKGFNKKFKEKIEFLYVKILP